MTDLNSLLPPPTPITAINVWATVTQVSPLRIQVDGDPSALPITPDSLIGTLNVNDRVWVQLTTNTDPSTHARQVVVIGKSGGPSTFDVAKMVFPIGHVYVSLDSTNPGTLFGGTWTQLEDRFLVGAGNLYAANATGGEATHTLTLAEIPPHTHQLAVDGSNGWAISTPNSATKGASGFVAGTFSDRPGTYAASSILDSPGGGGAHNNMPPYLAVYMWQRTG